MFTNINEIEKKELTTKLQAIYYNFANGISFLRYIPVKNNLIIVDEGMVKVALLDREGNQTTLALIDEGDVYSDGFFPKYEMMEMIAQGDVRLIIIEITKLVEYESIDKTYKQFLLNYNRVLNRRISEANERINYLAIKTIRSKLLFYFNNLSIKNHSKTVHIPFSYTILAEYLAIDRSAMNRELKNLKDEKIISTRGRYVTLLLKDFI